MKKGYYIYKITFLLLLIFAKEIKARNVKDPTWQIMIDSSEVIARVKFTSGGTFLAKANILTIYKGSLDNDEITIHGFSDKNVKVNYIEEGDEYFVFLKRKYDTLSVWTPTTGFFKVDKKKIQYNLLLTTRYPTQEYYSLKLFEKFIQAAVNKEKDNISFHKELITLVKSKLLYPECAQYILMLKYSGYTTYNPIFLELVFNQEPDTRIAVARLLGNIHTKESRENLVTLLANKDEIVAEEAANQLINFKPEEAGPPLLRKFESIGNPHSLLNEKGTLYPFKITLLRCLVEIQYQPAAKVISHTLQSDNEYLFKISLDAMATLKGEGYISYLGNHISKNKTHLYDDIFKHILEYKIEGSKDLIMEFINQYDKSDTTYAYLISSKGLGTFNDTLIEDFIAKDFEKFWDSTLSIESPQNKKWISAYYDFFTNSNAKDCSDKVYYITASLIDYNLEEINSDTIYQVDSNQLKEPISFQYPFDYFLAYLSKKGTLKDLIFLHKMESYLVLNEEDKLRLNTTIQILEKRINEELE